MIPPEKWIHYATVHQPEGNVEFLVAAYGGDHTDACKGDYEEVEWFKANHLPSNIIPNLAFLIPAAKLKLERYHLEHLDVHYPNN